MQFFLRPDVDSAASGRKKDCVGMLFTTHRNACNQSSRCSFHHCPQCRQ